MYALPDHFELLSDPWIDEARRVLEKALEQRSLPPFSVSERYRDPPPHLELAEGGAAWTARYDGETLTVSRSFDPEAQMVVEGDYQAAVSGGQVIGLLAPGTVKHMRRELAAMYGQSAIEMRGRLEDRAVVETLSLLHDHLGRRTVENPDLAHRAARQGLTGKIRELEENGYCVVERAISPEFADEVRDRKSTRLN